MNLVRTRSWWLASLLACATGCSSSATDVQPEPEPEPTAQAAEALFAKHTTIWPTLSIVVCWDNFGMAPARERGWVQDQIQKTWEAATRVRFLGWAACTSPTAPGIHIRVADERPRSLLGTQLDGVAGGMTLNFTFGAWPATNNTCIGNEEACIRRTAAHEFGHALGMSHEDLRADQPVSCQEPDLAEPGDHFIGPYDPDSIMNYCNPEWNNGGELSDGDITGIRNYYGWSGFDNSGKAAVNWDNKLYFFTRLEVTRWDIQLDRVDDGYPVPVEQQFHGWPQAWLPNTLVGGGGMGQTSAPRGIDAALAWPNGNLYFFRKGEYIRYSMQDKIVTGGPTPIAVGWRGWPASWDRVDSAILWNDGNAYFFRGSEYIAFNVAQDRVVGGPLPIAQGWPGLFSSGIDRAVAIGNQAYFFKGSQYSRYTMGSGHVADGYPYRVMPFWVGVPF